MATKKTDGVFTALERLLNAAAKYVEQQIELAASREAKIQEMTKEMTDKLTSQLGGQVGVHRVENIDDLSKIFGKKE